MLCARCLAMGFLLSKARPDGQFPLARLSAPRGPLHQVVDFCTPLHNLVEPSSEKIVLPAVPTLLRPHRESLRRLTNVSIGVQNFARRWGGRPSDGIDVPRSWC